MDKPNKNLFSMLEDVYEHYSDRDEDHHSDKKYDFAFHMTDWMNDLANLVKLYENPEGTDKKEFALNVYSFVTHASSHILAAAELLDYQPIRFDSKYSK